MSLKLMSPHGKGKLTLVFGTWSGYRSFGMKISAFVLLFLGVGTWHSLAAGEEFAAGKVVDLSHAFDEATIYWPTEDG
ncbi:MAG TPA: hypothetical protein VD913_05130, partial [bacterium]|nr:hypothetical protein [bacterium]